MKAKSRPRFNVDTLRDLAGEKVFERGQAYHRDVHVQMIALAPGRVLAQVAGTDDYRTELTGRGKSIDGECSCPAFEDWGFCKHMVAVALAANDAGGDAEAEGAATLSRIRDHLKEKGIDALVDMIMDMAERDAALFRKLDLAATTLHADDKTIETRLRKAIDNATRTRGFVEYREVPAWAADVEAALDTLASLASNGRADIALRLAERALERIEQAIAGIDESDGHGGALLERARDIHLAAARIVRPEPVQFARDLFVREVEGDYETFAGAAALYANVLGADGLAEYRRLATEAWQKLPARSGKAGKHLDVALDDNRLSDILDFFAERDGDVDARIALRSKDLSSPWRYFQLAEFCRTQGRKDEALRRAEEGLWVFEDDRLDERLLFLVVDLLSKAGRKQDAEAHLWRAFEKAPSLDLYARLRKLGGQTARARVLTSLETRLAKERRSQWHYPADLFVRILTDERMFDMAWAVVRKHGASMDVKETLARASEATHPREALEAYAERIDRLANAGDNQAYAEAAKLVRRMSGLRSETEQAAFIADLKARHGRKRNFMKLLR